MPTLTQAQATKTAALTFTPALAALASGAYAVSATIDQTATIPLDQTIEVECVSNGAPTGNQQLVIFAETSLDGTNWTGPATRALASDGQENFVGSLPITVASVRASKSFSYAGQPVSRYFRLVAKNDMGVAITSAAVYLGAITGVST
jgi:hypothetical protein